MQTFQSFDWLQLARDVCSSLFALAGLYVAWLGLKTWRRQLKGTHDYEAARQILRATLKLRDALQFSRRVPFGPALQDVLAVPAAAPSEQDEYTKACSSYYERACGPVWAARTELQAALFEAEVLAWDDGFKEDAAELFVILTEWNMAVSMYVASHSPDLTTKAGLGITDWIDTNRKVVGLSWADKPDAEDGFDLDLQAAITQMQRRLAKHIKA